MKLSITAMTHCTERGDWIYIIKRDTIELDPNIEIDKVKLKTYLVIFYGTQKKFENLCFLSVRRRMQIMTIQVDSICNRFVKTQQNYDDVLKP